MRFFVTTDGTKLAYRDEGEGLPVLALAGLTRDGRDFDYVAPHLEGIRLIRLDSRGRGQSGWSGADTYTVPQEADDAIALLDHLKIDKAAILGTSRGGLIAMLLGAVAKGRLHGICLNDVGPVLEPPALTRIGDYIGKRPVAKTIEGMAEKLSRDPAFPNVPMSRWIEEAERHYVQEGTGLGLTYDPELRTSFIKALDAPAVDAWPLFDAMKGIPTMLVRGHNTDLLSEETANEMRKRIPEMIFVDVADRGHVPFLDEPLVVSALQRWIGEMKDRASKAE